VKDPKWARPAGHAPELVTCFNKKDVRGNQWPGCDYTLDATGGWYDAGDHGKYVVNAGISVWTLLNYYERTHQTRPERSDAFADGKVSIPERGNGVNDLLDEVRWEMNFLLGMQAPEGAHMKLPKPGQAWTSNTLEFIDVDVSGMAHHKVHGERWTAMPSAPDEDHAPRYAYPPSVTATLNLAANAAQCARVWRNIDPAFSKKCLDSSQRAYAAALRHPDLLPFGAFSGGGGYGDRDASDEFYWAAAELFVTTGEDKYLEALKASPHFLLGPAEDGTGEISWGQTRTLGTISLAEVPNRLAPDEIARARANITAAADRYVSQAQSQGYAIPYASMKYEWGSNSTLLNHALVLGTAYDFTSKPEYRDHVIDALDYLLGRNPLDQSYVSGYGTRPLEHPHHRFWGHQFDSKYPTPPPGALSGGPNSTMMADPVAKEMKGKCFPQTCYKYDSRAFALNEVAINWNAPLVWVAAFADE
jgi:endoglucanase